MNPQDLLNLGYSPIPIQPYSKNPGFEGWQTADSAALVSGGWPSPNHGTGIRTGDNNTAGIDTDIYDAGVVQQVKEWLSLYIGDYVSRVGQAPKTLIPIYCPDINSKMVSRRYTNLIDGTINAIEILSQGQQFIIDGIHPDTMEPYTIDKPLPPVAELPVVTLETITALFDYYDTLAVAAGWVLIVTPPSVNRKQQTSTERLYNDMHNLGDILTHYGWQHEAQDSNRWIRPGKRHGVGGTITGNALYCFTSSSMLEPMVNHRPYDIVLAYNFNGDESAMEEYAQGVIQQYAASVFTPAPVTEQTVEQVPVVVEQVPELQVRSGFQYLSPESQASYFEGCVYVSDDDKILIPNGRMLNQSQFKSLYGGYVFAIADTDNAKTTPDAWKAFTNSQVFTFPTVDYTCFNPTIPPRGIETDDIGHRAVNTYIPATVSSTPGDATPFLQHVQRLIPNETDRAIIFAYMAACVQHIGVKFQWCPLVQGVQGNGKSLLTRCLKKAIGERYCHVPNPQDIDNKFNDWLQNKLLIVIEEVNVRGKYALMDVLKPMITQRTLELQAKGGNKSTKAIFCNFFMNSNYRDAIIKTAGDRRHAVFYTAQQEPAHLDRDGMGGSYFPELYKWLREGGYAIVTDCFQTYQIPNELNPATECQRAPHTTSTQEAIEFSLGDAEQAIFEAIEEGRPGFMGGWVSSIAVGRLLQRLNIKKPVKHIPDSMESLGYVRHPGLKGGRCNTKNMIDGGKPRLYVKRNGILCNITGPALVNTSYVEAQGLVTQTAGQQRVVV